MTTPRRFHLFAVAALLAVWLSMMLGGAGSADRFLLAELYAAHRPLLRNAALLMTTFGDWQVVLLMSLFVAGWMLIRKQPRSAALLMGITLGGRLLVDLQKRGVGRLRPDELEHLVLVKNLSFPSGHAANSMILFLSVAIIASPPEHRRWAVAVALIGTFLVGLSRPMLGVHYPSDVIGGWSFGAAWVLAALPLARRWLPTQSELVRR